MIPFVVFAAILAYVALRVVEWKTISSLGFKLAVPQGFLDHAQIYKLGMFGSFISALVASSVTGNPPLHKAAVVLVAIWGVAWWLGRNNAFDTFRRMHLELLEYESSLKESNPSEYRRIMQEPGADRRQEELVAGTKMSNKELRAMLRMKIEQA